MSLRPVLFLTATCLILSVWACEPDQYHNGCKIIGASCKCGWGCKTEYIYKTRRACRSALRAPPVVVPPPPSSSDICSRQPCSRGICLQTTNDIGFTCKCEGTGFYGQRCEKDHFDYCRRSLSELAPVALKSKPRSLVIAGVVSAGVLMARLVHVL